LANYWLKDVIVSKEIPFSLLPPVSLVIIRIYFIKPYNHNVYCCCFSAWVRDTFCGLIYVENMIFLLTYFGNKKIEINGYAKNSFLFLLLLKAAHI